MRALTVPPEKVAMAILVAILMAVVGLVTIWVGIAGIRGRPLRIWDQSGMPMDVDAEMAPEIGFLLVLLGALFLGGAVVGLLTILGVIRL